MHARFRLRLPAPYRLFQHIDTDRPVPSGRQNGKEASEASAADGASVDGYATKDLHSHRRSIAKKTPQNLTVCALTAGATEQTGK